jgi:arabinogalactan oligomer/maltooligosaccharide transport system permease protein
MTVQVRSLPDAKKKHSGNRAGANTRTVLAYLSPAMIGILLVNIIPIIYSFYISLTNRNGPAHFAEGNYHVTGFQNYVRLLGESDFYLIFGKTLLYTVVCVPLFFVVGLTFAIILNNSAIKVRTFWRTLMILPWAVPYWITALIWKFLFHSEFGPINQILRILGLTPPNWLVNGTSAFIAIVIINIWLSFPFFMLILLGGLQSIPSDLYEAAEMDGASFWQKFFNITLPMLRPVSIPAIILSVISTLKIFETIYLVTGGGPVTSITQPGATELLMVWAYNQGFATTKRFGVVGAFSIVVFLILFGITLIYTRITRATKSLQE